MAKRIAVLMGGTSSEREVSLVSGRDCAKALAEAGYVVDEIDVTDDVAELVRRLTPAPDAVFNALHGRFGEDGTIQGLLDLLRIPYTHSGVLASALAMDKVATKRALASVGIRVPEDIAVTGFDDIPLTASPAYDLTTWRQPVAEMTRELLRVLEGAVIGARTLGGALVVRTSSGGER